ncbi:hypothetical protein AAHN93_03305 [Vandammella animalimorsus]|uniref:hypothetical protein n=1 Tax=Vandammella animalimorsus TaxID=2029117 RepID=UPI0031BA8291
MEVPERRQPAKTGMEMAPFRGKGRDFRACYEPTPATLASWCLAPKPDADVVPLVAQHLKVRAAGLLQRLGHLRVKGHVQVRKALRQRRLPAQRLCILGLVERQDANRFEQALSAADAFWLAQRRGNPAPTQYKARPPAMPESGLCMMQPITQSARNAQAYCSIFAAL